ncbi:hypothetical protein HPP92_014319 [Vanilla planifolia]|uniref:Choline transporter-like protein n=1 Tax=Vanilla planifolia TaxID=51239 RepID=A0A835QU73_VANPL|nr:hypothetical protein HPP92_014319 [Vanilla planifolia]
MDSSFHSTSFTPQLALLTRILSSFSSFPSSSSKLIKADSFLSLDPVLIWLLRKCRFAIEVNGGLLGVIGRHRVEIGVSDAGEEPMEGGIIGHNQVRGREFLMGDIHMSVDDWLTETMTIEFLTAEMRNTSLQLQGPCYPVIFPSVNEICGRYWEGLACFDSLLDGLCHCFLSIIWLLLIRHFVAGMTWITVILFNSLVASVTMFCYAKLFHVPAGWIGHDVVSEINHLRVAAVLMTILMIFSILSSIAIVRRLLLGTTVLKVAAKVIGEVQALIVFPVFPCIILGIFYVLWISAAMHLFSSGQLLQDQLLLTTGLVVTCRKMLLIFLFLHPSWAPHAYNLGSVALGSLVLPFVEFIRIILESLRRKLKISNAVPVSQVEEVTLYSSKCVLGCVNWTLRSVNRSAYIMIAITGKGFCKASSIATGLIMNNILCIGKVNVIGDIILVLGKLCVSLFCAVFAFLMLDSYKYKSAHNRISSPLFPVLVCWGLGYVVATLFFVVVEMSIDTIIISFSARMQMSIKVVHNLLLPFSWRPLMAKEKCRDLPRDLEIQMWFFSCSYFVTTLFCSSLQCKMLNLCILVTCII